MAASGNETDQAADAPIGTIPVSDLGCGHYALKEN